MYFGGVWKPLLGEEKYWLTVEEKIVSLQIKEPRKETSV